MSIDIQSIRAGDEIVVRLRVREIKPDWNYVIAEGPIGAATYGLEQIQEHIRAAFVCGEQVRVAGETGIFEIEGRSAKSEVFFCTRADPLRHLVCHASVLERVA